MNHNFEVGQEFTLKGLEHENDQWRNGDIAVILESGITSIKIECVRSHTTATIFPEGNFMEEHMELLLKGKAFVERWIDKVRAS